MNESIIPQTKHYTGCASLAAIGVKLQELDLFGPIRKRVHIAQKTVKHTPIDKLYDGFISLLAGAHGLVEINTRLRSEPALQEAFGRQSCAEQSVVQQSLDACTAENVSQLEHAMDEIYRIGSQGYQHDYQTDWQVLDVDMSGLPCGSKAAFATKGYFAKQRNRRGRQIGRVLASRYDEIVVDRLYPGTTQLNQSVQSLIEAAETTLNLSEWQRVRTIVRLDSGGGSLDDVNWLLARGYLVHTKDYSGQRARRLAETVSEWFDDPKWPERQMGWVSEPATAYVRPVVRIAVRCRQQNGQWAIGVLISAVQALDILRLTGHSASRVTDPVAVLLAYVSFYDQRGGGIETSFEGDKQGLGMTKRSKKRFEAQQMLMLLGSLAHNVIVWARRWLMASTGTLQHYGMLRMVRDVFHISGFLLFAPTGHLFQIVLNQDALLAHALLDSFRELLAPMHIAISLDKT
jgi:Transposase DDE domain group 1